ncbi:MAG TPA: polyphosphate kinase 1 [Deltaproteobacteria bacterium]|nr:polyphosphate kinase 1 [Deltaproteobacteria bacterium]
MPVDYTACDPGQLQNPALYINRELSWFEFNQRVLDQAMDPSHPLLERVKFLAIVGNNLDEFFMIRLATILKKFRAGIEDISPDGMSTQEQIRAIRERALRMMEDQNECWEQTLRPRLEENGVHFLEARQYTPAVQEYLRDYFSKQIFPVLTPLALDPAHPFPHISNLSTNFAVGVESGGERKFARVKIPNMLPRFVPIPEKISPKPGLSFAFLEDVMRGNLAELFPGIPVEEAYLFRVIRDTDLVIQEDEADDLLESVDKSLKQLRYGAVSLLTVETAMPPRLLDILLDNFQIEEDMAIQKNSRMCFSDWLELTALHLPQLKYPPFSPRPLFNREEEEKIFDRFRYTDYLVHHPYESFTTVESFLKVAVDDPQVVAIKMTLYRIGPNSPIVDQLIEAAEAGKQVAAVIELKARFDERNNIVWANRLESAGVHVNYGLVNLKTHAKLCMVVRKEGEGVRRYVHLGTGNYNRSTAQIYTDLGLFTTNPEIAEDVSEVFNYLTGYSNKRSFHRLLVAPINLRSAFLQLIERETEHARAGRPARLILKCNHLTDLRIIQALYRASQAGVDVDMIVRSVCGLRPGIPGISEGIRVSSIVGRFLEHHRIYYFQNGGEEEIFIGSADLMERNLDHRVETLCPILDPAWREQLKTKVLEVMLQDNVRASQLYFDGHYEKIPVSPETERLDSQQTLLECYTAKTRVPDNA